MFMPIAKKPLRVFTKWPHFHFDGIANHHHVIYVCFELEMSPACDIGGGPTLLGAAKTLWRIYPLRCLSLGTTDWRQTNLALRLLRRSRLPDIRVPLPTMLRRLRGKKKKKALASHRAVISEQFVFFVFFRILSCITI